LNKKNTSWLDDIYSIRDYDEYIKYFTRFPRVLNKIKSENDLCKILFDDVIIIKQAEKCGIPNWKKIVEKCLNKIIDNYKTFWMELSYINRFNWNRFNWNGNSYESTQIKGGLIYEVYRFKMDVYTFLRMFRSKGALLKIKKTIFHSGSFHTENMVYLINELNIYNKTKDIEDAENKCLKINIKRRYNQFIIINFILLH